MTYQYDEGWSLETIDRALLSREGTKARRLQDAVLEQLAATHHAVEGGLPTSVRFLFYELEQRGVISKAQAPRTDGKKGRRPDQDLIDAVTSLREAGVIPEEWIKDETRHLYEWAYASSVAAYALDAIQSARLDPWTADRSPIILTESRATGGILAETLAPRYLVALAATNGQARGFLVTKVAPLLRESGTHILYLGDYDLAGDDIENNTRRVLADHAGRNADDWTDWWERVAITRPQVQELRQTGVQPVLKTDKRHKDGNPHKAFECEALGQVRITNILRARLDELLPVPLERVLERQAADRRHVERQLRRLR